MTEAAFVGAFLGGLMFAMAVWTYIVHVATPRMHKHLTELGIMPESLGGSPRKRPIAVLPSVEPAAPVESAAPPAGYGEAHRALVCRTAYWIDAHQQELREKCRCELCSALCISGMTTAEATAISDTRADMATDAASKLVSPGLEVAFTDGHVDLFVENVVARPLPRRERARSRDRQALARHASRARQASRKGNGDVMSKRLESEISTALAVHAHRPGTRAARAARPHARTRHRGKVASPAVGPHYKDLGSEGDPWPSWLRSLDRACGVYIIRDKASKRVLYVGSSLRALYDTITRHFQGWHRSKKFFKGQYGRSSTSHDPGMTYQRGRCELAVRIVACDTERMEEARQIGKLKPRDNITEHPDGGDDVVPF